MNLKKSTRDAYGEALAALGRTMENVVVLDADLSKSTRTSKFAKEFPQRFFNAGIAEQNLMGIAAGLATMGKIPFVSSFAVFAAGRAFEQIRNTICYSRLNVKIAATHAGITVGEDGGSHQSVEDVSLMRSLPNMTVIVPADAIETEKAIKAAAEYNGPVYIRLGRADVPILHRQDYDYRIGVGDLIRDGKDISLFSCGIMTATALEAADILAQQGISAEVINIHTIKPLDVEMVVKSCRKTGVAITIEEHSIIGGLGSAVSETLIEHHPVPLIRIGLNDTFGQSGSPDELLNEYGLNASAIVNKVLKLKG